MADTFFGRPQPGRVLKSGRKAFLPVRVSCSIIGRLDLLLFRQVQLGYFEADIVER
jgi:hypothetical protein